MRENSATIFSMDKEVNSGTQENFTSASGNMENSREKEYSSLHMAGT